MPTRYFYPRPPRGGRLARWVRLRSPAYFYPRPPRGGRLTDDGMVTIDAYFYPRPPRGGRLALYVDQSLLSEISIHALREEGDTPKETKASCQFYFYPRPPRGGRHLSASGISPRQNFYPRPPRGGRRDEVAVIKIDVKFLSTPSARRATRRSSSSPSSQRDFYPRPPRGGRQQKQRQNLYFLINYTTFCTNLEEP